jgi:hypothetical protein
VNVGDSEPRGITGHVTLTQADPAPDRTVEATVRLDPPSAADDANWITATAWQGGGKLHLERLDETSPGVYRTTEPIPVYGTWKTLIRLHRGDALLGLPVYLPADEAIPADAVPAKPSFTRSFVDETEILQRELKDDVPGYLAGVAYSIVAAVVLAIILLLGWVLVRIGRGEADEASGRASRTQARRADPREAPA